MRERPFRRSLLRLLSYGRGPHPCPSPVRVPFGEGFTDLLREALLLPLVGRTDSAEGRARRGSPGMKHLTDEGLKVLQPQGPGLADCLGLPLRLMDGGRASTDSPMPGAPLLARPSAESVLPHKGEGNCAPALCESASPNGRGRVARSATG